MRRTFFIVLLTLLTLECGYIAFLWFETRVELMIHQPAPSDRCGNPCKC